MCVQARIHLRAVAKRIRNVHNFNTPVDNDTNNFNNAHDIIKIVRRTRLMYVVKHTPKAKKKQNPITQYPSKTSKNVSWNVIFGRRRNHVTYRATVMTGDNSFQKPFLCSRSVCNRILVTSTNWFCKQKSLLGHHIYFNSSI